MPDNRKALKNRYPKIGIFDSGVGGLTVAQSISKLTPLPLIYFGDSARLPYGNKSKENILAYSRENVKFLLSQGADVIVVACNTSSAIAINQLRSQFKIPIIGVIDPGVMAVIQSLEKLEKLKKTNVNASKKIGVVVAGTFRTVDSHIYWKKISTCYPNLSIYEVACPLLVPIIEEGMIHNQILYEVLKKYLEKAVRYSQVLLLGCTHYPLIKNNFKKAFPHLQIVDSAESTAFYLREILTHGELSPKKNNLKKLPISTIRLPSTYTIPRFSQQITSKNKKKSGNIKIFTNDSNEVFTAISNKLFPGVKIQKT